MAQYDKSPPGLCHGIVNLMKPDRAASISAETLLIDLNGIGWLDPGGLVYSLPASPDDPFRNLHPIDILRVRGDQFHADVTRLIRDDRADLLIPRAKPDLPGGAQWLKVSKFIVRSSTQEPDTPPES